MQVLKTRSRFVRVTKHGKSFPSKSFVVQVLKHHEASAPLSCGVTASKKVGNAVARNRAKRRMRVLLQDICQDTMVMQGCDVVMIARHSLPGRAYQVLRVEAEEMRKKVLSFLSDEVTCAT